MILGKSLRFSEPQFFKGDNEFCSESSLEGLNEINIKLTATGVLILISWESWENGNHASEHDSAAEMLAT